MNLKNKKYHQYALCREMLETPTVVRNFQPEAVKAVEQMMKGKFDSIFLTGEGSSRIFPAKNAMTQQFRRGGKLKPFTEGATQALEYDLSKSLVLGSSNSGKTKEVIRLFQKLKKEGHQGLLALTAQANSPLENLSHHAHVLSCGGENAVAATKSVVEQGLYVSSLLSALNGTTVPSLEGLPEALEQSLTLSIDESLVKAAAKAKTIYFAGRNDGIAEELTLKTNEITRKKSDFLEGTYGVHGIEEVMEAGDVLVLINPFESEEEKFETCLKTGAGVVIIAISHRPTRFPTILIPESQYWQSVVELCAGWNLLVEIGLVLGIDLDKPTRARKVGNEYVAG
jgi:glutamine---fructose-6-phosphate transaminase (isomerizing)